MDKISQSVLFACVLSTQSLACSSTRSDTEAITPEARADAAALYQQRCAQCHGATGHGDGPKAAELDPKPRNFSDITWHLAVSDRHIDEVIRKGGPAANKSPVMKANPELADKPVLLAALRQYVRELARRPE